MQAAFHCVSLSVAARRGGPPIHTVCIEGQARGLLLRLWDCKIWSWCGSAAKPILPAFLTLLPRGSPVVFHRHCCRAVCSAMSLSVFSAPTTPIALRKCQSWSGNLLPGCACPLLDVADWSLVGIPWRCSVGVLCHPRRCPQLVFSAQAIQIISSESLFIQQNCS